MAAIADDVKAKLPKRFPTLSEMIQEGFEKAADIQGKDIIIFLGPSGVGKSTLITYLMDAEMVLDKISGRKCARPKIPDPTDIPP